MEILVIRPGALGDVLLTLPALQALQAAFPGVHIDVMGSLPVIGWLPGRSVVHAAHSFERADLAALFRPEAAPSELLERFLARFEVIVSYAAPPGHLFARNLARLARGRVLSVDARPRRDLAVHMSDHLLQPLHELGVPASAKPPHLRLTAVDKREAAAWWAQHHLRGAVVVAVHPGSGSRAKNWAADRFAALVQRLHRSCGARSLVVAGPADKHAVGEMQRALAGVECIPAYDLPLPLLAALLARCQAYVGNDSGPTHLAAALGVPTVAIFGPTDPDLWAPREPSVQVVRGSAPCAPCSRQQRQACDSSACLQAVPVRAVVDRLQRLCPLVRPPDAETA